MSTPARFYRPECQEAQAFWCELTGEGPDSAIWAEVHDLLVEVGLVEADQPDLFDGDVPDAVERPKVRLLRLAIVAGAMLWRTTEHRYGVPTSTAIVVALASTAVPDLHRMTFNHASVAVTNALTQAVVQVCDTPGDALSALMMRELAGPERGRQAKGMVRHVLRVACLDDTFAASVFEKYTDAQGHRVRLFPLAYGGWVVYRDSSVEKTKSG